MASALRMSSSSTGSANVAYCVRESMSARHMRGILPYRHVVTLENRYG